MERPTTIGISASRKKGIYTNTGDSKMNKYAIITVFLFSYIQAPVSLATPEDHSFEESLGTISKNQSPDQSVNAIDINIDQYIEAVLLMSPFQWVVPENTTAAPKNSPTHQPKALTTKKDAVDYHADVLDFASAQLIAEEITTSQVHAESAAYIQPQATAAAVQSIFESGATSLLDTDDAAAQWDDTLASFDVDENHHKANTQALSMISHQF